MSASAEIHSVVVHRVESEIFFDVIHAWRAQITSIVNLIF